MKRNRERFLKSLSTSPVKSLLTSELSQISSILDFVRYAQTRRTANLHHCGRARSLFGFCYALALGEVSLVPVRGNILEALLLDASICLEGRALVC